MKTFNDWAGLSGVELVGVEKSFGPVRALAGIDLVIGAGETVALLGPNGAGKSTLFDIVLGLAAPDIGSAQVFGRSPMGAVDDGLVAGMLQTGGLPRDLRVGELVAMMASLYPAPIPVGEALGLAGVVDLADRKVHRLSGGQTQRVRFAAVVVGDPMLLVLDEPTVAMDVEARQEFWVAIHRFANRGRTVLFATHYLEEADGAADRIVVLAAGRVVGDGSATEIKSRVGARTVRATLPDVDIGTLARMTGVSHVDRRGDSIVLTAVDSDVVLRDLLRLYPECRDVEVRGAGLEQVYVELTQPVGSTLGVSS